MLGCIIQARMGSSRLPGKVLKKINDKYTILEFQLEQLSCAKSIEKIVIATTTLQSDNIIESFCQKHNIECFRGKSDDVLDRYYECAKKHNFSIIIRLTSDNPLIDPLIIDNVIQEFKNSNCDYMSTDNPSLSASGFTVEIFNFESLHKSWTNASLPSEREHVTPYIYKNKTKFRSKNYATNEDFSKLRCTVDTEPDLILIKKIVSQIKTRPIHVTDVVELFNKQPNLQKININIEHDGYGKSLEMDKKFLKM